MVFIVFEGIDGAGKTSLMAMLSKHLNQKSIQHVVTREPGGTTLGDSLRQLLIRTDGEPPVPRAEILMYEAIRAQHVDKLIKPTLELKKWVLCDRFTASSIAFQSSGRGINDDEIKWLNDFATSGLKPDLTVLLDLPIEESLKRRQKRENETNLTADRFEKEQAGFHQRVRESYLRQAQNNKKDWVVLDATKTSAQLFETLIEFLKKKDWLK